MKAHRPHTGEAKLAEYYKNRGLLFKTDVIVLLIIIILSAFSVAMLTKNAAGDYVEIYYKGELLERRSLQTDATIVIDKHGHNVVVIEDAKVRMEQADCQNQICVKSSSISYDGQRIICAPNGIIVIIRGGEIDAITGGHHAV
ncbi:MAG: NusG domain II-containing protein [Clostridia bacterium]|nr:NusG domain II-containing protein [Clostridia bacterium]